MKKIQTLLCLALTCILLLSACSPQTGQSSNGDAKTEDLKPVTLKMYFVGEPGPDNDMVFKEISKILKKKINAELEAAYLSWGDYLQRYPLLFSSGEEFDMVFTAAWMQYSETSTKGGFYELTPEILKKYAPLTMENLPQAAWDTTKVNGKNYMIPYNNFYANHYGAFIRGDLRKKYGMDELKTIDDIEAFMEKVAENEPGMIPLNISKDNAEQAMRASVLYPNELYYVVGEDLSVLTYNFANPDKMELKPFYEAPGYLDYLKRVRRWNQKGFISKSDLTTANTDRFDAGKSAVKFDNISNANAAWQLAKKNHPEWEVEYINLLEGKKLGSSGFVGNGCAFNARSKNVERAIMAADLLNYDPELNYLINNGIPDVHSKLVKTITVNGHEFQQVEVLKPGAYGGVSTWCFTNKPTLPAESFPGYNEITASYFYDQIVFHPLDGMSFAVDSVSTQVANCSNLIQEYLPILYLGFAEDPEATLNEFISKMKAAGMDDINAELTRQAQEIFDNAKK